MLRTLARNKLTSHPSFPKIIAAYNTLLAQKGKVSGLKFYNDVILPEIPDYSLDSWYFFLKKFRTEAGIVPIAAGAGMNGRTPTTSAAAEGIADLQRTFLTNSEATQKSIAAALNISAAALQDIIANPELLSVKERAELFVKVMKAQDSRVKAVGAIRADNREQERFDRAQSSAAYD